MERQVHNDHHHHLLPVQHQEDLHQEVPHLDVHHQQLPVSEVNQDPVVEVEVIALNRATNIDEKFAKMFVNFLFSCCDFLLSTASLQTIYIFYCCLFMIELKQEQKNKVFNWIK